MRTNTRLSTNQPASTSVSTANFAQKNCPNKILVKANEEIPAVHVDYGKGKKLYKFDCAKYGEICPTGAIIKQEGKSPILNTQKCIGCGACKSMCWHGIIEIFSVKEQKTNSAEKIRRFLRNREKITDGLKELGIKYVTLDLEGFRSGSMDI